MSWFDKLVPSRIRTEGGSKRQVPEGVWSKCGDCSSVLYRAELERMVVAYWRKRLSLDHVEASEAIATMRQDEDAHAVLEQLEQFDNAIFHYNQAISLNPQESKYLSYLKNAQQMSSS